MPSVAFEALPCDVNTDYIEPFHDLKNWLLRPPSKMVRKHLCHDSRMRMPHLNMQGTDNLLQVSCISISLSNECPTPRGWAVSSIGTNQLWHAIMPGRPPKLHDHVTNGRQLTGHRKFSAKNPKTNLTLGRINACLHKGQCLMIVQSRRLTSCSLPMIHATLSKATSIVERIFSCVW